MKVVKVGGQKFTKTDLRCLAEMFGAKALRRDFMQMIEIQAIVDQMAITEALKEKA